MIWLIQAIGVKKLNTRNGIYEFLIFSDDGDTDYNPIVENNPLDPRPRKRKKATPEDTLSPPNESSYPTFEESTLQECYVFNASELFSNQRDTFRIESDPFNSSFKIATRRHRVSTGLGFDFSSVKARK